MFASFFQRVIFPAADGTNDLGAMTVHPVEKFLLQKNPECQGEE